MNHSTCELDFDHPERSQIVFRAETETEDADEDQD